MAITPWILARQNNALTTHKAGAPLRSARFYLNHQQLLSHIHINHIHINHIRISHTRISVDLPNKLSTKSTANRAV